MLQLPAVQDRLTDQLEKSLSSQLNTELSIGRVGLDFPKFFTIEEVYLETPAGDSLFTLGKLGVDIDMIQLFRKQVVIQKVKVEDVFAKIMITDSTSNIQFLLDAFVTTDTSTGPATPTDPVDTTATNWAINFPNTSLSLQRADIYYQDDPTGILLDGQLETFELSTDNVNLEDQIFDIDKARLIGGNILLEMKTRESTVDSTATPPPTLPIQLTSRSLTVENTVFRMRSEPIDLLVQLPETQLEMAQLLIQDSIRFEAAGFSVVNGRYAMDLPAPELARGFDPNHMDLQQINIEANAIQYTLDSVLAQIDLAQAVDKSGLTLEKLSGHVRYQPDLLNIQDLELATQRSTIDIPSFQILYNFQEAFDPTSPLVVNSLAEANLAVGDLLFFLPQLDTVDLLRQNAGQHIKLQLHAEGDQQLLRVDRILLDGPGLRLRGAATVRQILDVDALTGNFQIEELSAIPEGIIPLLPDSLLPAYIDWPQYLRISGNLRYASDDANFNLRALEQRDSSPINSVLAISGQVQNIQQYPSSSVDVTIDTLRATRYSALAYLPENSIPAGYNLPNFLKGTGTIKGPINDLVVDLVLLTESERTQVNVNGQVRQVLNADSLYLDLNIPLILVDIPELREILPDSTLPSDLNFPDFRITNGALDGTLEDLNFNLPISTINGEGIIAGHYAPEDYNIGAEVNGFRPEKLYQGARADSLALLDLDPLRMELKSSGQLEPELVADLNLTIYEGSKGALLNLEGTARRDTFSGEMTFSHADLQGSATTTYIQKDSLQEIEGSLRIKRADLERWRLSDRPLYLSGSSKFSTKGLQLDNLSARLSMNDILLRSDTSSAFVDTLSAYAEMHDGNNEIEVFSDLLNFSLEGSFRPALVFGEITRFIQAYWQEEIVQPDPVVYGNYMNAYLEIRNPRPLTSGVIPGLRRLSPMSANFIYRERAPELLFTASLPLLNYAGIKMDSLEIDTRGSQGEIQYRADWKNINLFNQVILGRTQIKGQNTAEAMEANFLVYNEAGTPRHHIQLEIDPEEDSLLVRLGPEQLIDNTTWTIPGNNLLLLSGRNIRANNWTLSHNGQSISLKTPNSRELLAELNAINLAPFSRLIRSEEEIIVGVMDGTVEVKDPLGELRFDAQLDVKDLSVYSKLWGDLSVDVANQNAQTYRVNVQLAEATNEVSIAGTIVPDGAVDLQIDIGKLQLEAVEPLSLGYLSNAQGHLAGNVTIGGTFSQPSYQGELRFVDAAIDVALLQTRFQIENEAIRFSGQTITIDNLTFYDPQNNEATLSGSVYAESLANYRFNLSARARDFLVMNTNKEDNELYYGYLKADADIEINGDIYQPRLEVTASPKEGSNLTYNLIQNTVPQAESRRGVVRFVEQYEWQQTIVADSLEQLGSGESRGFDLITNLNVNPGLNFTVVIDPVTGDQFTGRGAGDIVFHQYPDGRMEMTGRIEMVEGLYDFTYQGLISRQFSVETGSSITWQGDPMNPSLDLTISSFIQASPYPLVNEFGTATASNLRRQQTFAVRMYLDGTLEEMQVNTDIIYPEDISGNSGLPAIEQSLTRLRTDQSQLNTQAFGLLLFKGFVNFGDSGAAPGGGIDNSVQSGLDNVLSQQLNNLANRYINFVELDFGLESFNTAQGGRQRDLRLSLRKRLFNDRLIISIDGVTQTGETDENNTLPQTYLDNLTAEFLLSKNGGLRLKVFSDRELDQFTTGDVVRIGGRLAFSKDFDRFFWSSDKKPAKDPPNDKSAPEDGSRDGEQKIQIEKE
ncbi:hypothetical protein CRP01_12575 [Flavilitoribacter nigricans DSM 23189 = NBRC 102662]|uniref:Translocation and assembly module TamB C-terminal domain-containing protein n=1 Tax=Flavilitoribacter nigricans (strain ATCC 23147 / DSM 23189 / NBRC 102662 / NCIMB 1420 / SS-2) TaxID=1122177 RepID=A0A2D0NDB5_FLAN2|nr:hypothetical protein CRP01_12575 [Flavilitoribacter nigricans DSM 23189 = NBRC 102662]